MNREDRMLWLAGGLAATSLLLAAGALTIALIAASHPPVSRFPSPELDAKLVSSARFAVVAASAGVFFALWALAQTIARRPLGVRRATALGRPVSGRFIVLMAIFAAAITAFCVQSIAMSITRVLIPSDQPLLDNMAFGMLGLGVGVPALMCGLLSNLIFLRWWQGTTARIDALPSGGATTAAA